MKWKTGLFLSLSLILMSFMVSLVQAQSPPTPDTIFQQEFNVPGPDQQQTGKAGQGVDVSFSLTQTSTAYLSLTTNLLSPTLNVYVLFPDDYAVYKTTGSLAKATPLKSLSKLNTVSYKANGVLTTGTYGVVIQWGQTTGLSTQPNVILEVDAAKYVPPTPTPTP